MHSAHNPTSLPDLWRLLELSQRVPNPWILKILTSFEKRVPHLSFTVITLGLGFLSLLVWSPTGVGALNTLAGC